MVPWHHFKLKLRQIILINANVGAHVHLFNVDLALISKGSGKKDTEVRKKNWVYKHIKQTTLTEINNNKIKKKKWMNEWMYVCMLIFQPKFVIHFTLLPFGKTEWNRVEKEVF